MLGTVDIPVKPASEQQKPAPKDTQKRLENKPEVKPSDNPLPDPAAKKPVSESEMAYTIQLGSFNNAANVKTLVSELRTHGFTAYTVPQNSG